MTVQSALESLTNPKFPACEIPDKPGLYAVYATANIWEDLGLGTPPDTRPLYVGKAEESLYRREFQTHFGGGKGADKSTTGSSTVRRSFAALLKSKHGFVGVPRNLKKPGYFTNFGLSPSDDRKLTDWMEDSLLVATWCPDEEVHLGDVETAVLAHWEPPLNLSKVKTPWKAMLSKKRAILADEASRWTPAKKPGPSGLSDKRKQLAREVSALLQQHLSAAGASDAKPADVMPYLISKGVFKQDGKPGQALRELLRDLDNAGLLNLIPQATAVRAGKNRIWFLNPV